MNGSTTIPGRAGEKDYPAILGLPTDADTAAVRRRYRQLAREHHPDQGGNEEKFKEITEAYEVLSDPSKRAQWEAARRAEQAPRPGWGANGDFNGFERSNGFGPSNMTGEDLDGDILNLFRRIRHVQTPVDGGEIHIDALQALEGHEAEITLHGQPRQIRLPSGLREDTEILVDGNTLLSIRIHPHPQYRIEGEDLEVDVPVGYPELVLGGEVQVPTPYGNARVRVPAGTQPGARLRLAGRGARIDGRRTSLYARLQVQVPRDLNPEAKKHLEEYARAAAGTSREQGSSRRSTRA